MKYDKTVSDGGKKNMASFYGYIICVSFLYVKVASYIKCFFLYLCNLSFYEFLHLKRFSYLFPFAWFLIKGHETLVFSSSYVILQDE